ncbi:MAG: phosphate ABC transporter substrate-binding protein PstS [Thermoprotei archaeon]
MKAVSTYVIVGVVLAIVVIGAVAYYMAFSGGQGSSSKPTESTTSQPPTTTTTQPPVQIPSASITAGGSTFVNPAMQVWVNSFQSKYPQIQVTYSSVGSGAGVNGFLRGSYDIGATDAPPPSDLYQQMVQKYGEVITIPDLVGGEAIIYNLPGFNGVLNLTADVIAGIYSGKIQYWDDPAIQKLNPYFKLPHQKIIAVHRSDGSGTTFIFTYWLYVSSQVWRDSGIGYGYTVNWPVDQLGNGLGGKGNEGVTAYVKQNQYSIGYVEVQYAIANNLASAAVQNPSTGQFVQPSAQSLGNAVANVNLSALPPANQDLSKYLGLFFNAKADNAYPIVSFSWLVIKTNYDDKAKAIAIYLFLKHIATTGQKELPTGYLPLPQNIQQYVLESLKMIKYNGQPVYELLGGS